MIRINQLRLKYLKTNNFENYLVRLSKIKTWIFKTYRIPKNIDFSLLRISPIDSNLTLREQFIPLARSTIIRKLSQNSAYISKSNQLLFEDFSRYLDACITNRNFFFLKEVKSGYKHLNPDVEVISGGIKWTVSKSQILDDEFWFMQKFCRLLELANFKEMNRDYLEKWLTKNGGYSSVQVWIEPSKYELLKVWLLGRENCNNRGVVNAFLSRYLPSMNLLDNPFKAGYNYRRVAIAVRVKNSDKIELKMFKELWEGELIHTLPEVEICHTQFDSNVVIYTGGLMFCGLIIHWMLPIQTISSGWLLSSTHQLATWLVFMSGLVGLINWHVIQQKKSNYWKWRSELNYRSIVANNRGVISLIGDRAQDEIFKESLLTYVNILAHPDGLIQKDLETIVKRWALENCNSDFKETAVNMEVNLTESLSLLRQLNIINMDSTTQILTAKPLDISTAILGSEFTANNLSLELDGHTVIRNDCLDLSVEEPLAEGFEKKSRSGTHGTRI